MALTNLSVDADPPRSTVRSSKSAFSKAVCTRCAASISLQSNMSKVRKPEDTKPRKTCPAP
eukprot:3609654-Rhodomonas_salina.4